MKISKQGVCMHRRCTIWIELPEWHRTYGESKEVSDHSLNHLESISEHLCFTVLNHLMALGWDSEKWSFSAYQKALSGWHRSGYNFFQQHEVWQNSWEQLWYTLLWSKLELWKKWLFTKHRFQQDLFLSSCWTIWTFVFPKCQVRLRCSTGAKWVVQHDT